MRLLSDMDDYEDKVIEYNIRTTLRSTGGRPLILYFRLEPCHNNDDKVMEYCGMLRDISEMDWIERQMDLQTAKVQEVAGGREYQEQFREEHGAGDSQSDECRS